MSSRLWLAAAFVLAFGASPARAETDLIAVTLDQAKIAKLPAGATTLIIGNPMIADVTMLKNNNSMVITGKGYGSTNLLALDRAGRAVMNKTVQVVGAGTEDIVVVYKGIERETLSCAPDCEHRITLGDSTAYFSAGLAQSAARNGQAQAAAPPR